MTRDRARDHWRDRYAAIQEKPTSAFGGRRVSEFSTWADGSLYGISTVLTFNAKDFAALGHDYDIVIPGTN